MSKKVKKIKKVDETEGTEVETPETSEASDTEKRSTKKKKAYKRGDLGRAVYALFDKVGVDNVTYDQAEAVAKRIMATTKFNTYHFSWYKNKYNQKLLADEKK